MYHQRWRIEECFKLLKCRLAVEHFSGELPDSVRQDFLAKVWLGNLTATFAYLARGSLPDEKRAHFLPNLTYAVAALRASLPRLMTKVRTECVWSKTSSNWLPIPWNGCVQTATFLVIGKP